MNIVRQLIVLLFALPAMAFAATPLTSDQVDRFLNTLEEVNDYDEKYGIDIDFDIENEADFMSAMDRIIDESGQIQIFTSIFDEIAAHPEAGPELRKVMNRHGFRNEDEFAEVGNRLALALIRSEMSGSDITDLREASSMSAEQLAYVPEQMRPLIKRLKLFVAAIESVPAENIELAKKAKPRLEALEG